MDAKKQTMADFKNDILKTHNTYRKTHRSNPLKWSNKLQANAQRWADKLAKKGYLQHENQSEEGENIACMKGAELTGERAATMWYDEVKYYDYSKPTFSSKTGHFTQLVWNGSTELGVGRATASNGMQFVVARYNPPGNILGKFPDNVFSSNGKPPPTTSSNNSNNNRTTRNKPEKRQQQPSGDKQSTYLDQISKGLMKMKVKPTGGLAPQKPTSSTPRNGLVLQPRQPVSVSLPTTGLVFHQQKSTTSTPVPKGGVIVHQYTTTTATSGPKSGLVAHQRHEAGPISITIKTERREEISFVRRISHGG